jgi:carbonic anhydrase/acetyltransferase-like protein (isoleucine patch superfamily)
MAAGTLLPYRHRWPKVAPNAFVAAGSTLIGDVFVGPESSVWFNCALRGDVNPIRIGARSNVQDGTIIHTATKDGPTLIGDDVVVGHMCLLHACVLEDGSMVGMGATVMDYAVVETGAWVAAGALVTPGKRVKTGEMWMGRPARPTRAVTNAERETIVSIARRYAVRCREFRATSGPPRRDGGGNATSR